MKKTLKNSKIIVPVVTVVLSSFFVVLAFADSTVVVRPFDMASSFTEVIADPSKWFFYNDENDTINNTLGSFVAGPGTTPLGSGSVQISVSGTQRRNLATYQFFGTPLASITQLKFSTYNPSAGNPGSVTRSAYLNFNVDFNGSDTWQRRLVFTPRNNGTVTQNAWKEWDALQGGNAMWSYSGPTWPVAPAGPHMGMTGIAGTTLRKWSDILADYPGVRIRVTDSWLGMRVGEPYADGYTENLDKFVFGTASGVTTYDFELPIPPTPTPAPTLIPAPSNLITGTINVVKTVINDNGGTRVVSDFPLFVNGMPVISGQTYTFPAPGPVLTVNETGDPNYARSFSGDCDANGQFNLIGGQNKFCIVANNDIAGVPGLPNTGIVLPIPPLMDLVQVPSPLALPGGPGSVMYTYTLRNIGTVPVINITIVGDTCSPIVLVSGDTNNDAKMDVNETWVHTCTSRLTETHTNTAVATGLANGITAVDIASARVVVGAPVVPPLIHVTKVPNPLVLPVGGGMVTYTNIVTNPGVVPLTNVRLVDDKCDSVNYIFGDMNGDSKLDTTEAWTYICSENLTQTTTNTVVAEGEANGITQRDFAIVTVVVAVPSLPDTGTPSFKAFTTLSALGLKEGEIISANDSSDPDVYLANAFGYKRLFLNPVIFGFYGHLGGFSGVKTIVPTTRDTLTTSSLYRNCETNNPKVYSLEITGEDTGTLHWINATGAQAVADDPNFFKKIFCINNNEFNWYQKGFDYTSVSQVP